MDTIDIWREPIIDDFYAYDVTIVCLNSRNDRTRRL